MVNLLYISPSSLPGNSSSEVNPLYISPVQGWASLEQYNRFDRLFEMGLLENPISQQIYAEMRGWA